jgi:hypothetical protein
MIHPENTITHTKSILFIRIILKLILGLVCPLVGIVSPITIPLTCCISSTMRVSELNQNLILVLFDFKDSVSVIHYNTIW